MVASEIRYTSNSRGVVTVSSLHNNLGAMATYTDSLCGYVEFLLCMIYAWGKWGHAMQVLFAVFIISICKYRTTNKSKMRYSMHKMISKQ